MIFVQIGFYKRPCFRYSKICDHISNEKSYQNIGFYKISRSRSFVILTEKEFV